MQLTPLWESDSHEKRLKTIKENVEIVSSSLYGSNDLVMGDKLSLLEYAVKIKDEKDRGEFVSLIGKWCYVAKLQIEAYKALKSVAAQLETFAKHSGKSS